MEWNLKINGEKVRWNISDTVAIVPSTDFRPSYPELEEPISKFPDDADDHSRRKQRDQVTFERAGWRFTEPSAPHFSPDGETPEETPDKENTRQVYTTERGDLLIETDVATVQLNAAAKTNRQTAEKVLAGDGLRIIHELSFAPHLYAVRLPAGRSVPETIDALQAKTSRYVFAEPSVLQRISGRQDPTDPQFGSQWQHSNDTGLHSVAAWEVTKGDGVRIAIIDNGMQIDHDELKTAIVGGGYFKRNGPGTGTATFFRYELGMAGFPVFGHGTACMGMAGARDNNAKGGCGIAPRSELLAIACAIDQTGTQLTLARAIEFAINPRQVDPGNELDRGADVISCSLGTATHLKTVLELAINSAASGRNGLGVPIFWAVDNQNTQLITDKLCSLRNVIAVGRSDKDGKVFNCARGPKLEFLAPGLEVFGPTRGNDNIMWSGTSFATPLAAGVAALVMSEHRDWTAQQVLQRLRDTCDMPSHPASDDDRYGHGRINAHRAVQP